jgi:hypothetical protein
MPREVQRIFPRAVRRKSCAALVRKEAGKGIPERSGLEELFGAIGATSHLHGPLSILS